MIPEGARERNPVGTREQLNVNGGGGLKTTVSLNDKKRGGKG